MKGGELNECVKLDCFVFVFVNVVMESGNVWLMVMVLILKSCQEIITSFLTCTVRVAPELREAKILLQRNAFPEHGDD